LIDGKVFESWVDGEVHGFCLKWSYARPYRGPGLGWLLHHPQKMGEARTVCQFRRCRDLVIDWIRWRAKNVDELATAEN
jgi:hypothetical protein